MTKRLLSFVLLLFTIIPSFGQDIGRQDADSMLRLLKKNSTGIDRVHLLLSLAEYQIHKPGENKIDFDSATTYINEAALLNNSLKSLTAYGYQVLVESYLNREKGQQEEAKKKVEKAVGILETGRNKTYLGDACYELSTYYDYNDPRQMSKKIVLVKQSIDAFQQGGNIQKKAFSLKMLGDLYGIEENYQEAIDALQSALSAYNSINYKALQGVYALLGRIYTYQNDYSRALRYELKALNTAEALKDSSMQLCEINNYIGGIYMDLGKRELAVKYYKDAIETAKKHNDSYTVIFLLSYITPVYSYLHQPQEALDYLASIPNKFLTPTDTLQKAYIALAYLVPYLEAKQYDRAGPYCNLLVKLVISNAVPDANKSNINRFIASYYFYTKQYSNARIYLTRNKDISKRLGGGVQRIFADAKLWYRLDSAQGNFQSAFNYLRVVRTITDSLFNVTKSRQLQQIEVEYETAKKEDSIKLKDKDILLLTKENSLQLANLKQARIIKNATIAGIILAFVIIGLLYRQYRHKQKSNDVISNKNKQLQHLVTEKEWLLKEIHHRVKNNLQVVMSLLNSQSAYIENDVALTAIHDSQHRVNAMSLIHQKLYNSENVSSINMSSYIHELVSYLSDSFNTAKRIRFQLNIAALELDVSQAVPLGLILNEAITNSIKYAFPEGREGLIDISLLNTGANHYLLSISDNGIGMPAHFANKKSGSLGMSLMAGLSEDLDGNFAIGNNNGTTIRISFVHDLTVKRTDISAPSFVTNSQE